MVERLVEKRLAAALEKLTAPKSLVNGLDHNDEQPEAEA
jgi:hypothetical protein